MMPLAHLAGKAQKPACMYGVVEMHMQFVGHLRVWII